VSIRLPRIYRRLIARAYTQWDPWHFVDDATSVTQPADFAKNEFFQKAFRTETGADFDVYLFARRRDREDFAFFSVGPDGSIEDSTHTLHLTFSDKFEFFKGALRRPAPGEEVTLRKWLSGTLEDIADDLLHDGEDLD
jgi:hypothetical protein